MSNYIVYALQGPGLEAIQMFNKTWESKQHARYVCDQRRYGRLGTGGLTRDVSRCYEGTWGEAHSGGRPAYTVGVPSTSHSGACMRANGFRVGGKGSCRVLH